jgi:D-lactate dehydrogenase (cytochrome)
VSRIVHVCAAHRVATIPFGAGVLEGHVAALKGGLCIDISRMTRIIAVHAEDLDVTLEAGVTRQQLNEHLRDTGLFFPVDPSGESTSHPRLRHQCGPLRETMRENVVSLIAVAPASPRLVMISLASSWDRRGRWGLYHFSI